MSITDWFNIVKKNNFLLYKKEVLNKDLFITNRNGDRLIEPSKLQYELDKLMKAYNCFCFIRPSGTENVIRIYIESKYNLKDLKQKIDFIITNLNIL